MEKMITNASKEMINMNNKTKITKKCTECGTKYTPNSNRQKYCPECKNTIRLAKKRINSKERRAKKAFNDKALTLFGPHCPKNVADDWSAEVKKIKAEKKRTFKNSTSSIGNDGNVSARKIALENLTYDERDSDFKGSIEDFFNMKDD
jgi:predicted  nucleic acid-binding Zn-ribbon protein